jgi:AmmeMemoRadiSam system protein A
MEPASEIGNSLDLAPLSDAERRELLRIGRSAVGAELGLDRAPELGLDSAALRTPGAAFVSIYVEKHLRGCVGTIHRRDPLHVAVARLARAAAFQDPRFPAVGASEWPSMAIEISRLGELRPARPEDVVPGRHGVCVARGDVQGLLLPQVADRYSWTRERLLDETCIKAGLAPGAWREAGTQVAVFVAEVFGEGDAGRGAE